MICIGAGGAPAGALEFGSQTTGSGEIGSQTTGSGEFGSLATGAKVSASAEPFTHRSMAARRSPIQAPPTSAPRRSDSRPATSRATAPSKVDDTARQRPPQLDWAINAVGVLAYAMFTGLVVAAGSLWPEQASGRVGTRLRWVSMAIIAFSAVIDWVFEATDLAGGDVSLLWRTLGSALYQPHMIWVLVRIVAVVVTATVLASSETKRQITNPRIARAVLATAVVVIGVTLPLAARSQTEAPLGVTLLLGVPQIILAALWFGSAWVLGPTARLAGWDSEMGRTDDAGWQDAMARYVDVAAAAAMLVTIATTLVSLPEVLLDSAATDAGSQSTISGLMLILTALAAAHAIWRRSQARAAVAHQSRWPLGFSGTVSIGVMVESAIGVAILITAPPVFGL